jgi:hypothetical protein
MDDFVSIIQQFLTQSNNLNQETTEYKNVNVNENELIEKSIQLSESIQESFSNEVINANSMNLLLNTTLINSENTIKLLEEYSEKNNLLKQKLKESHGDILTNDRKTYYESEALDNLNLWYRFFLMVYFVLVAMLCLSLVFSQHNLTVAKCIIIGVLTIFYPLYIDYLVNRIYGLWKSIIDRLPKNVYNNL